MLHLAILGSLSHSVGQTLALLATFGGLGLFVNILIFYIVAQVIGEHKQNQEHGQDL